MSSDSPYTKLTREEIAEMEVGKTTISPATRFALVAGFLLTIVSIPLTQHVIEVRAGFAAKGHWMWPKAHEVWTFPGRAIRSFFAPEHETFWQRFQSANATFMHDTQRFEKALEDDSFLAVAAMPHTQALTASFLGLGNEEVYLGRKGWLFYQPEVGYLTGEGFLRPDFLRSRARSGHEAVQPDPLKAIVDFRDQLARRGVHLIVLPAPVKPMIEPEHLSASYRPPLPIPIQNPSYGEFLKKLDAAGVDYLDVSGALAGAKLETGESQFLLTDTHWLPGSMEMAAELLARKIRDSGLSGGATLELQRTESSVSNIGDIANMLKLPPNSRLYPPQTMTIRPVHLPGGEAWKADPAADILVLGDSFSNIYSLEPMGWGASAGLVEQLSYYLRQGVDAILRNDAGAHATRELLAKDLAQGKDRLAGKKIVVWEFASRELSVGDWKMIGLPEGAAHAAKESGAFYAVADGAPPVHVTAVVRAVSPVPRPGSVPYKDHVFAVELGEVSGEGVPPQSQAVVYLFGMKDNVLTPAAGWKAGDRVKLDLRSWNDVSNQYDRFNRSELDDPDLQLETPSWGDPTP